MKKVILIGDSIKFGYAKYVQTAFSGVAEVDHPNDGSRFAEYISNLHIPPTGRKIRITEH